MNTHKNILIFLLLSLRLWAQDNFVIIPEASFIRYDTKNNSQIVELSEFMVSSKLITIKEWKEYLIAQNLDVTSWERSILRSLDNWDIQDTNSAWPAWHISWIEAIRYCNWLSDKHGLTQYYTIEYGQPCYNVSINANANGYSIPTLAQWQYISEIFSDFLTQEIILHQEVVFENNPNLIPKEVSCMNANSFGIYDILGNVQEFFWDYFNENNEWVGSIKNPLGSKIFTPDPDQLFYGEPLQDTHIISNGMWATCAQYIKSNPTTYTTSNNKEFIGFRLVRNNK